MAKNDKNEKSSDCNNWPYDINDRRKVACCLQMWRGIQINIHGLLIPNGSRGIAMSQEQKSDARCTKKQIISSGGSGGLTICL
jgi:hypothetical protein